MEILQIKNLTFTYPETHTPAVDNLSLTVNAGEFIVICGGSGCGKSTLLRLIKSELSPYGEQSGDILYNGAPIRDIDARTLASDIGMVLQNPDSQIVTDSVWHELAFGLESLGTDSQSIRRRVAEMASYFGIEHQYRKRTDELSGGGKQLLNLASVMAMTPKLLLLDEPTAQLDPITASNFISTLKKLNRDLGLTVILVEHRLEEVLPVADRFIVMDGGSIAYDGNPRDSIAYFNNNPRSPVADALPAAMRIYSMLEKDGVTPVTVKDGREYLQRYNNTVKKAEVPTYTHDKQRAVTLKGVYFRYAKDLPDIMRGVSFEVYNNEHFCILGGNGAGKSTALSVIAGINKAYRGKVMLDTKRVAMLPQNVESVFVQKSVYLDLKEVADSERVDKMLKRLGITHLKDKHPYDLSGGEMQKCALAKVLLNEPSLLLLDEPTKAIDAYSKNTLADIISMLKNDGVTVITVTHDVEFAAKTADRVGIFFDGELLSSDTPVAFFSGNSFYTTAAARISSGQFENAVLCEQVVSLCRQNGKKEECVCP